MSTWSISKSFEFSYGHRVWSQVLNTELSIDGKCSCRFQHGHNGKVVVYLTGTINNQGMVMDFRELQFFKVWLDSVLDHKMILDLHDPSLPEFYPVLMQLDVNTQESIDHHLTARPADGGYFTVHRHHWDFLPDYIQEIYEGLVIVPFIPTSENLSKWLFDIVQKKLEGYATVEKIEFWETPKSCSTYGS